MYKPMEIVEQLRRAGAGYVVPGKTKRALCNEALTEIERLRAALVSAQGGFAPYVDPKEPVWTESIRALLGRGLHAMK